MEYRYVVTGASVTAISAVFIAFSIFTGNNVVLGVSLSTLVLGVVLLTLGLTYVEPVSELMRYYVGDLDIFVTRILEDMGIASNYRFKVCFNEGKVFAVFTNGGIKCGDISLGVGIIGDSAYVAIPLTNVVSRIDKLLEVSRPELIDYVREVLVSTYGICRDVRVWRESNLITVELILMSREAKQLMKTPINPPRMTTLLALARYFNSSVEIVEEDIVGDNYVLKVRIVGG